jgi:hypothetical protein
MTEENHVHWCERLTEDDENRLRQIARDAQEEWFKFMAQLPAGDAQAFCRRVLSTKWRGVDTEAAADCLFAQFIRLDLEITPADEDRLRGIARDLHEREGTLPGGNDYFSILEAAVAAEYKGEGVTFFRVRHLADRLSELYIFGLPKNA